MKKVNRRQKSMENYPACKELLNANEYSTHGLGRIHWKILGDFCCTTFFDCSGDLLNFQQPFNHCECHCPVSVQASTKLSSPPVTVSTDNCCTERLPVNSIYHMTSRLGV